MSDPIIAAARRAAAESFGVLEAAVDGLDARALNARPAGEDTNSIAVLTTHALKSTRMLLGIAVGQPPLPRDRPAEFAATATGPEALLELLGTLGADILATLDDAGTVDWSAVRSFPRADGTRAEMTAAWALIHGIDHLRGHADEAALTRHVVTGSR
ncbi:MAG TPA: hypothetical protein DCY40_04360 [Actinobacteria bacterium]|nr:hypothetical protein [Actinomycetota bacterium]